MASAVAAMPAAATGRHRREGSVPVGNSKSISTRMNAHAGEPAFRDRARLVLAAWKAPGKGGDPQQAVGSGQRHEDQAGAFGQHEPADEASRAADDERAERGVGYRGGQGGQG